MRLSRPVYESLPYAYGAIGALAFLVCHLDPGGVPALISFVIGFLAETAALTLVLRRQDCRELAREYTGETIELRSTLRG